MPGKVPDGDETLLYALPEDQPDSLSEGHKSKRADLDDTPAEKAGTADPGSKGQDPVVTADVDEPKKAPAKKAAGKSK